MGWKKQLRQKANDKNLHTNERLFSFRIFIYLTLNCGIRNLLGSDKKESEM